MDKKAAAASYLPPGDPLVKEKGVMKIVWKKKADEKGKKRPRGQPLSPNPNLPFGEEDDDAKEKLRQQRQHLQKLREVFDSDSDPSDPKQLAELFQSEGDKLAEGGRYREALGKWEAALTLMPEKAALHEQKAQVLLEIGDAWGAVKAATRATELDPSWAEAWITLARAQLNFGEPDSSIESFDKALSIKPDSEDAKSERKTASRLIKKREQLRSSGLCYSEGRFVVGEKSIE